MPDLTVAICTYRRLDVFRDTLESLSVCAPPDCAWELLIVDNAGDTKVEAMVDRWAEAHPQIHTRYEIEPALGTSHARNHAVHAAASPIVLFTDDDVTFDPDWLQRMWQAIVEHSECAFWGGRVEPKWSTPVPRWFDTQRCPMLGDTIVQYRAGEVSRPWDPRRDPPFYTANLALRKKEVVRAGYFDTTVGHRGDVRIGAEDSLMVRAIAHHGGQGWYVADAIVHHPVPEDRVTRAYALQFARRQGWISLELIRQETADASGRVARMPRWIYRVALSQWLGGLRDWLAGALTFNVGVRFAGRYRMAFARSKLYHALTGKRA